MGESIAMRVPSAVCFNFNAKAVARRINFADLHYFP